MAHARRTILTDKPRITKFRINWGGEGMREETNHAGLKIEGDSNSSLLARKVGEALSQEEKLSTREEKDFNSQSIMKNELASVGEESLREKSEAA